MKKSNRLDLRLWSHYNPKKAQFFAMFAVAMILQILSSDPSSPLYFIQTPPAVSVATGGGTGGLLGPSGAILMHIVALGFAVMVITSFMKFTGRGDWAPFVMFIAGVIVLQQVMGLFNGLYSSLTTLLSM